MKLDMLQIVYDILIQMFSFSDLILHWHPRLLKTLMRTLLVEERIFQSKMEERRWNGNLKLKASPAFSLQYHECFVELNYPGFSLHCIDYNMNGLQIWISIHNILVATVVTNVCFLVLKKSVDLPVSFCQKKSFNFLNPGSLELVCK